MRKDSISRIDSDVLVIGGGGAGLRSAVEAAKHGVRVVLVSKSRVGSKNNTAISAGGLAAAGGWGNSIVDLIVELYHKYPKKEKVGKEEGIARFLLCLIHNQFVDKEFLKSCHTMTNENH